MSKIHVNRSGNTLGQFSEEEVQQGLNEGRFLPSDLAWRKGMQEWKRLGEWADFAVSATPTFNTPAAPDALVEKDGPAWEHRERLGMLPALTETAKEVLMNPVRMFQTMKTTGGLASPAFYYFLLGIIGMFFNAIYQAVPAAIQATDNILPILAMVVTGVLIVGPAALCIGLFVYPAVLKVSLWILGEKNAPYETLLRVVAYGSGSTMPFYIIPFCGGFIGSIWGMILTVLGVSKTLNIGIGKTIAAVFLPIILCCGLFLLIGMLAGGMPVLMEALNKVR